MREAVIVSTARTPIGKAYRGSFNNTHAQTLAGHSISEAVKRAKVEPSDIDDEIVPLKSIMKYFDKETKVETYHEVN